MLAPAASVCRPPLPSCCLSPRAFGDSSSLAHSPQPTSTLSPGPGRLPCVNSPPEIWVISRLFAVLKKCLLFHILCAALHGCLPRRVMPVGRAPPASTYRDTSAAGSSTADLAAWTTEVGCLPVPEAGLRAVAGLCCPIGLREGSACPFRLLVAPGNRQHPLARGRVAPPSVFTCGSLRVLVAPFQGPHRGVRPPAHRRCSAVTVRGDGLPPVPLLRPVLLPGVPRAMLGPSVTPWR